MEWKLGKKMFSYNLTIKSVERVKRTCYEDSLIFCKNELEVGFDQESGWVASSFSVVINYLDMVLLLENIPCKMWETWKMGWEKHDVDYIIHTQYAYYYILTHYLLEKMHWKHDVQLWQNSLRSVGYTQHM